MGPYLGKLRANLASAGVKPEDIDTVLLTHMHTDHIGGLLVGDEPAYPRASVMVAAREVAYWRDRSNQDSSPVTTRDAFDVAKKVAAAYGQRFVAFDEPRPDLRNQAHHASRSHAGSHGLRDRWRLRDVVIWGDICHVPEVQCLRPDVTVVFDVCPTDAIATRRAMLARAAREDLMIAGMHMPFPGVARIVRSAEAYVQLPQVWQYDLMNEAEGAL
jgi:glyoxylase-like metal-dependent hydrolase (beta-lactamase superfamily II)